MRILCIIFTKKLKIILKSKGFYKTMVKQNSICTVPFSLINLIFCFIRFFLIDKMFFIPRQKTPHTISLLDTLTHTHTHTHTLSLTTVWKKIHQNTLSTGLITSDLNFAHHTFNSLPTLLQWICIIFIIRKKSFALENTLLTLKYKEYTGIK